MAGASATALAADRRTSAQRLLSEAARLEELAADERRVAHELSKLPASYSILHDLQVPGAPTSFGHVVLGPGGVFLVVSHRHDDPIVIAPEVTRSDDHPLSLALRAVTADAGLLADALGTPVAPVVALVGPEGQAELPVKVDGVTLVPIDRVARAVSRGSHTLLASKAIEEVSERALPLLTTPSKVDRIPDPREAASDEAESTQPEALQPESAEVETAPVKAMAEVHELAATAPSARHRAWRVPTVLAGAAVAAIGLIVFAAGSLVSTLGSTTTSRAAGVDSPVVVARSAAPGATLTLAAPRFVFSPACTTPGAGWQLQPKRLDAGRGAAFYEIEARGVDGAWARVATLAAESLAEARVLHLASGALVDLRVTALAADGRRSAAADVQATTPRQSC